MNDYLDRLEHQYEEAEEEFLNPKFNYHPAQYEILNQILQKHKTYVFVYLGGSGKIAHIEPDEYYIGDQ